MESGVVGRNLVTMSNNTRPSRMVDYGGVPINSGENERPSHSSLGQSFGNTTKGWGGSIWNNPSLGSGFSSAARESSRSRESGAYLNTSMDSVEGKTGSGSLVASSESDSWNIQRSPWGPADTSASTIPHARSSGVSPARQRTATQPQPSQPYVDPLQPSASYFAVPRNPALSQNSVPKPATKPLLDPTTVNFSSSRQIEPITNGFGAFNRFGDSEGPMQRSGDPAVNSWNDSGSLHSPTDDRRSIAASEYFGASSATPSRSGSLPPSRHGAEPLQFAPSSDNYTRFVQPSSRGHNSSLSSQANGRAYQERSGSIQSDTISMFGRLSIDNDPEQSMTLHKPSVSVNGLPAQYAPSAHDSGFPRDAHSDVSQNLIRSEEVAYTSGGTFTPDGYPNGQFGDHAAAQLRAFQFDNRNAITPNGSGIRPSPFYSATATPPIYDHLYPSRTDQAPRVLSNGNIAVVERKLRGLQQVQQVQQVQQEQQNFMNPQHFQPQQFQQMLAANQFRGPYSPYQFGVPNGIPVNGLTPGIPLPAMPGMMPLIEPPKAPRDHDTGEGIRSVLLQEFKSNSKTSRRYELKDIYDHIVEFSGDQHGSRFIQQKLETANSDEKERVFKELQSESLQLMQDVFGNYVIQKFFEHGDQNQKRILASRMKGQVLNLSLQMYGCRVVQKALEHILTDQQASLVKELERDVLKCVKDQNGNHVIQKAIERVPAEHIQFIIQAFYTNVGVLATHPYGCRVIQRMLEHCQEPARSSILQELHAEGPKLISDQYGNYVTQHVIEHGNPQDRAKIISLVKAQLLQFSKHKFASNVVEKCLVFGTDEQRHEIMMKVVERNERGESTLMMLIKDGYGNYVIQKLLDTLSAPDYAQFLEYLQPEMIKAKRIISGKQVLSVEKKMHRFERFDIVPDMAQRNSISSVAMSTDISAAATPLTSDAQSPQSSSLPSTNTSAVDEPVHNSASKGYSPPHVVGITNAS